MPILTPELIKSAEQMDAGWTKLRLIEAKSHLKDGFTNDLLIFEGVEGPGNSSENVGRRITHMISGKALSTGSIVPDVVDNMLKLIAALTDQTLSEVKKMTGEFSFAKYADKEVWGQIADETYQGKIQKRINAWAPPEVNPF